MYNLDKYKGKELLVRKRIESFLRYMGMIFIMIDLKKLFMVKILIIVNWKKNLNHITMHIGFYYQMQRMYFQMIY